MKYLLISLFSFFIFHPSCYVSATPKYEVRAVWLTTIGGIDWPHSYNSQRQKEELCNTLDELRQAGINMVLLQTRIRATTIFPSEMEPWDGCLSGHPGVSPGYDALQLAIDECHKRGMQLHAWVVTMPVGKWNAAGCKRLRQHNAKMLRKIGDEGYMNPEHPATADYLARFCRDLVRRYDVDGLHLDYIRYPETWPKAKNAAVRSERRSHITHIVRTIHQAVKSEKPWIMLSCAPIGKHDDLSRYRSGGWNARTAVCQDAQQWMKEGLMDALFPMMYFRDNQFFPFAIDWQERSYGRIVVPGLGIYLLDPREGRWTLDVVERQMNVTRQLGMGHCYFRSKFLTDNTKGIYDFCSRFDAVPSLVPPMTWMGTSSPAKPVDLRLEGNTLKWGRGKADGNGSYLLYNIYASREYPVDITKAENLMATRLTETSLRLPSAMLNGWNFAVTAMNRYGQESSEGGELRTGSGELKTVLQSDSKLYPLHAQFYANDIHSVLDADFVIAESLTGQVMGVFPYSSGIPANALPDGVYQLRSLHKKGRTHRLGYFSVKRKR
jgi:hypothetical protein